MLRNQKGIILITSYLVIAVLIILGAAFISRSISEKRIADTEKHSIQAFWLAEAGLDKAISELPSLSDDLDIGGTITFNPENFGPGKYYIEEIKRLSPTRFSIRSKGGIPSTDETDPDNIIRTITAIVEQPVNGAGPSGITSAITANGDIVIKGSAEVNGEIDDNAVFDFEDIFGISKDTMRDNATNLYTDPENNITPVNNITWVDIDTADKMIISDGNWEGSGILVVDGDLRITGGHFEGILWVTGTLRVISGGPIIDGTIFVESGSITLTGNPTVNFDSDAISDAFSYPSSLPPYIISWKEE